LASFEHEICTFVQLELPICKEHKIRCNEAYSTSTVLDGLYQYSTKSQLWNWQDCPEWCCK